MRTAAILPVKRFSRAKQRLGQSVADPLRRDLARAMVGDVLSALRDCAAIERTIVVTCEASVAAAARYIGAIVVPDAAEEGQSAAVALGIERAVAEGLERVLCVPGDCPALDPAEVAALLEAAGTRAERVVGGAEAGSLPDRHGTAGADVVIVPDRHGTGTNGLLLAPPGAIVPSFGPDSCERHLQLARAAGLACRVERVPTLLLDIDTGEDLAALRERLAGEPRAGARRTRKVLGVPPRPISSSLGSRSVAGSPASTPRQKR
ncbi:MAG TPA: NTP transferase domain-containing protein [Solirubrobacteraceae bacterium]|jgi:2-phospho-L-lactate guanylyltransferase|nr:NTP transferase domain-containing protein [Solirubrobacteraceae bacterium]